MNDSLTIALVLAAFVASLAVAGRLRRAGWISGEAARKSVHGAMGLVIVTFPWLFASPGPVTVLAALATAILIGVRVHPGLRRRLGPALHDIGRASWGDLSFPAALALVFWISDGDPVGFGIPVLLVALADSAAAFGGKAWTLAKTGRIPEHKTVAGSLAFFGVAILVTTVWLAFFTGLDGWQIAAIALLISAVTMFVERFSCGGFDNLTVPLAAALLLPLYLSASPVELVQSFSVGALFAGLLAAQQLPIPLRNVSAAVALSASFLWAAGAGFPTYLLA